ncbi:MAG: NYN domain-containing protein [Tindallia sp. MSAO_Bac2]|nr:MAG: NYN domain-containing protein [Tindallia sp. MSAO_Bac2]
MSEPERGTIVTKKENGNKDQRMALLIDGDNAQPSLIAKMLTEAGKYGAVTIKRIYGDWTTSEMKGWKDSLNNHAFQPIQQFRYTVGKNATDSALIIDAMDILHGHLVDGFAIVSSDSDYTRLATRIRENGTFVMGIGEQKTPKAFVNACDIFIYTENIAPKEQKSSSKSSGNRKKEKTKDIVLMELIKEAYEMVVQEDGWTHLGSLGKALLQLDPGFDPRSYGFRQLSQLIEAFPKHFQLKRMDDVGPSSVYVKLIEQ